MSNRGFILPTVFLSIPRQARNSQHIAVCVFYCVYVCMALHFFCFECLATMNFCGHITKWINDIMSKPARPQLDLKRP